jgi:putative DNA primase/helicase
MLQRADTKLPASVPALVRRSVLGCFHLGDVDLAVVFRLGLLVDMAARRMVFLEAAGLVAAAFFPGFGGHRRANCLPRPWRRKVVLAVPRHDLGAEQVAAFREMGVGAMLWKGRTAPDPVPHNPEQLMCLDPGAPFDALEVEHPVEQSCCKLRQDGVTLLCPLYGKCGYQRQKPLAMDSDVIVCAHDSLFHMKAEVIGTVGLLVIDEGFWQAGLRGLDGKAKLTLDGLEPVRSSPACYDSKNKLHIANTADLVATRMKLWKALHVSEPGVLRHGLLAATGLTVEECQIAAALERRRLRDAGLLPGMDPAERRARIAKIMPPDGMPWAPPGRCAILWLIIAEALENGGCPELC